MRAAFRVSLAGIAAALCLGCGKRSEDADATLVITDVTVIDLRTGALHPGQTLVIQGDRIQAVGSSLQPPAHARTVSGEGAFLIPGLWDLHVHAARDGRAPRFWPLFLAHGVTGIRETGSYLDSLVYWRNVANANPDQAPHIVWSSPMIDGDPPLFEHALVVRTAQEARRVARQMQAQAFDYIKVYSGLSPEAFRALSDEAGRIGIPIAGELPNGISPGEAAQAGIRSFEHLWNLFEWCVPNAGALRDELRSLELSGADESALRPLREKQYQAWLAGIDTACTGEMAADFRRHDAWQVPTLVINRSYSHIDSTGWNTDPRREFVPDAVLEEWDILRTNLIAQYGSLGVAAWRARYASEAAMLRRMRDAGAGILAGSDVSDEPYVYPGSSLHDELALLVEAGLTPLEALQAATLNVGIFLGRDDIGTAEVGSQADLVLLDNNPLSDIRDSRSIRAVVHRGRLLDRRQLDSLVELARSRTHN